MDERRLTKAREQEESDKAQDDQPDEEPSHMVLDFLTPGIPDMGEDADLFKFRRSESPDIIRV